MHINYCSTYIMGFNFCCIIKDIVIITSHVNFFLANGNTDRKVAFLMLFRITINICLYINIKIKV